jgi:acetolactate synthase-1/2/3 large subunit
MTHPTGGDLLVAVLRDAGVDTVFGVVSVHNLPLVEAVSRHLRFVPVRHEASAVNAADGYARAGGGLGCALTSTGTGAGNAAGSLVEALAAGTSVLHVTGQVELAHLGSGRGFIHETKDQLGMLTAVSAAAHTITDVAAAEAVLRGAVCDALAGGPVSVEWPIDLQYLPHPATSPGAAPVVAPPPPDAEAVAEAAALLAQAQRPLIWAGGGAAQAGTPLRALVERVGAGLLTSNSGRGAVPEDHPLCVGNYAASPTGQELLDEADLLLSIGTHFRSNETRDYRLRLPGTHIQVDRDPAAPGRAYPVKLGVVADAAAFLAAVLDRVPPREGSDWRERVAVARSAARARQREGLGAHAELADAVREVLPARAPIARDVTIASSAWGNRLLPIYDPRDNVFPRGGGIGQGLGMGIGAALARPDVPTLVMAGDGGLAVHLGELLTLAQERPWLVLMVFNDRGYGVLRNMQDAHGGPRAGVDLATPDFAGLAAAVGLPYLRIDGPASARPVLRTAVERSGPVLVEVDLATYGPMPAPFTPPVHVPTPEDAARRLS